MSDLLFLNGIKCPHCHAVVSVDDCDTLGRLYGPITSPAE